MEDLLRCSICLEEMTRPKRLSCNHIFCSQCLVGWYERTREETTSIRCPECRHETPISARYLRRSTPGSGRDERSPIDDLPTDRTIQQLLELQQVVPEQVPSNNVQCQNCESVFTNECPHCPRRFCQDCGSDHLQKEMKKKLRVIDRNLTGISSTDDFRERLMTTMRVSIQAAREKALDHINFHFDNVVTTLYEYLENSETIPDIAETKATVRAGQDMMEKKEATFLDLNLFMNRCEQSLLRLDGLEKSMDKLYDELFSFQWSVNKLATGVRERLDEEFVTVKEEEEPEAPKPPREASTRIRYHPVISESPISEDSDLKMAGDELITGKPEPSNQNLILMRELLIESNEEIRWEDYRFRNERPWVAIPSPSTEPSSSQPDHDELIALLVRTSLHTRTGLFETPTLGFIRDDDFRRRTEIRVPGMTPPIGRAVTNAPVEASPTAENGTNPPSRTPNAQASNETIMMPVPRVTGPGPIPVLELEGRSTPDLDWITSKREEIHQADTIMANTSSHSYEEIRWADSQSRSLRTIFAMLAEIENRSETEDDDVTYQTLTNLTSTNEDYDQLLDPRLTYQVEPDYTQEDLYYDEANDVVYRRLADGRYVIVTEYSVTPDVERLYQSQQQQQRRQERQASSRILLPA